MKSLLNWIQKGKLRKFQTPLLNMNLNHVGQLLNPRFKKCK